MSNRLEIEISLSSDNHFINVRTPIKAIKNGSDIIVNDIAPSSNALKERLKTIEEEKPPRFNFEWTPPEKHKTLFSTLKKKGKREPSRIFFHFFIMDGSQILWNGSAKADNCEVLKAITKGRGSTVVENVEVKCVSFKEVTK